MAATYSTMPTAAVARLRRDLITHLLKPGTQPIKEYLSALVFARLEIPDENAIPANPRSREFNSILPGLAAISSDYGSVGRTLLFEGVRKRIGLPTSDEGGLTTEQGARCTRLQNLMFGIPKVPTIGSAPLQTMMDFVAALDRLAAQGVPTWES